MNDEDLLALSPETAAQWRAAVDESMRLLLACELDWNGPMRECLSDLRERGEISQEVAAVMAESLDGSIHGLTVPRTEVANPIAVYIGNTNLVKMHIGSTE